jgi:phosphohistidine phosphatase SixA
VPAPRTIYLLRHAKAEPLTAASGSAQDHDRTLTDKGHKQARDLACWGAGPDLQPPIRAVYVSDYRRAMQTAQPLAEELDLPIHKVTPLDKTKTPDLMLGFVKPVAQGGAVLLVSHHEDIPPLIKAWTGRVIDPPKTAEMYRLDLRPGCETWGSGQAHLVWHCRAKDLKDMAENKKHGMQASEPFQFAAGGGGHWITLHGGEDGEEGEGHGVHVYVTGGGRVTKGPKGLIGADLGHLSKHSHHVTHHPEGHTPKGAKSHPSYHEHQDKVHVYGRKGPGVGYDVKNPLPKLSEDETKAALAQAHGEVKPKAEAKPAQEENPFNTPKGLPEGSFHDLLKSDEGRQHVVDLAKHALSRGYGATFDQQLALNHLQGFVPQMKGWKPGIPAFDSIHTNMDKARPALERARADFQAKQEQETVARNEAKRTQRDKEIAAHNVQQSLSNPQKPATSKPADAWVTAHPSAADIHEHIAPLGKHEDHMAALDRIDRRASGKELPYRAGVAAMGIAHGLETGRYSGQVAQHIARMSRQELAALVAHTAAHAGTVDEAKNAARDYVLARLGASEKPVTAATGGSKLKDTAKGEGGIQPQRAEAGQQRRDEQTQTVQHDLMDGKTVVDKGDKTKEPAGHQLPMVKDVLGGGLEPTENARAQAKPERSDEEHAQLQAERDTLEELRRNLQHVRKHITVAGGIRPDKQISGQSKTVRHEEWERLPHWAKRHDTGNTMDDMARQIEEEFPGLGVHDENSLADYLAEHDEHWAAVNDRLAELRRMGVKATGAGRAKVAGSARKPVMDRESAAYKRWENFQPEFEGDVGFTESAQTTMPHHTSFLFDQPDAGDVHVPAALGSTSQGAGMPSGKRCKTCGKKPRKCVCTGAPPTKGQQTYREGAAHVHSESGEAFRLFLPAQFAEAPQWIAYLPRPGAYSHPRYGKIEITPQRNQEFVQNFNSGVYQRQVPIDAEHNTKLSGAMGWIQELRLAEDGSAEARVDWTQRGRTLLADNRFRFFSPEFFDAWVQPDTGKEFKNVAIGGALTTRPFFKESALRPLVAAEDAIYVDGDDTPFSPDGQRTENMSKTNTEFPMPVDEAKLFAERIAALEQENASLRQASEAAATEAKQAAERVAQMEAAARRRQFAEEARGWYGPVDEHVSFMESLSDEQRAFYSKQQKALAEQLKDSALFSQVGRSGGTPAEAGAEAQLEQIARSIQASESVSYAQAYSRALERNPQLYSEMSAGR